MITTWLIGSPGPIVSARAGAVPENAPEASAKTASPTPKRLARSRSLCNGASSTATTVRRLRHRVNGRKIRNRQREVHWHLDRVAHRLSVDPDADVPGRLWLPGTSLSGALSRQGRRGVDCAPGCPRTLRCAGLPSTTVTLRPGREWSILPAGRCRSATRG